MSHWTISRLLFALFFVPVLVAEGMERTVAPSRHDIRPVLPGQQIPDLTFTTPEGEPFRLREVLSLQPVVLVVYRGGW
jgi:hypothetical protein